MPFHFNIKPSFDTGILGSLNLGGGTPRNKFTFANKAKPPVSIPDDPSATSPARDEFISSQTSDRFTTPSGAEVGAGGDLISGPPAKTTADAAFETYLASLKPSGELIKARENLASFDTRAALDRERALESGETLGFATGETARVTRQNAILRGGAAASVSALSDLEARRGTISKARFDFEKGKIDQARSDTRFQTEQDRLNAPDPFTLSPGQTRFDPETGKPIASLPPTPKGGTETAPGELSFFGEMVLNNPTLLETLTPSARGDVLKEIAESGGKFSTQGQQATLTLLDEAMKSATELANHKGLKAAVAIPSARNIIPGSPGREFRALADTLISQVTLPNLEFMRGLGHMSNREFGTIKKASTFLAAASENNYRDTSEERVAQEIADIQNALQSTLNSLQAISSNSAGDRVEVISPDGTPGDVSQASLEEALAAGYKILEN